MITQPANAWSNLAFVVSGLIIAYQTKNMQGTFLKLMGPISILIGLASFLYHASFTFFFQFFDLSSMYMFSGVLITGNLIRLNWLKENESRLFYIALTLIFMAYLQFFRKFGIPIFALQVLLGLFLEWRIYTTQSLQKTNYRFFRIGLLFFALALIVWILDLTGILCNPSNHWIQGHATWHVFCAISLYCIYKFYSDLPQMNSVA